jgi:hypothetical protein
MQEITTRRYSGKAASSDPLASYTGFNQRESKTDLGKSTFADLISIPMKCKETWLEDVLINLSPQESL